MAAIRKPMQGVNNIVRFNWHFYVLLFIIVAIAFSIISNLSFQYRIWVYLLIGLAILSTSVSLVVSWFVYDKSSLYSLSWLHKVGGIKVNKIANIHAGFDETSELIQQQYPDAQLSVFDFYNPEKHTEVSIRRARKAYPPYPGTITIDTIHFNPAKDSFDTIFLFLSAHEIRNDEERAQFFKILASALTKGGSMLVTEHLRDVPNFIAYNIGFFHFHSKSTWVHTFRHADLKIRSQVKITPFITTFVLEKK